MQAGQSTTAIMPTSYPFGGRLKNLYMGFMFDQKESGKRKEVVSNPVMEWRPRFSSSCQVHQTDWFLPGESKTS